MSSYSIGVQGIYTGFHSGRLAAVNYVDRASYQFEHAYRHREHGRLLCGSIPLGHDSLLKPTPTKSPAKSSLADCLFGCTVDTLKSVAHFTHIDYPSSIRKAELVSLVASELPKTITSLKKLLSALNRESLDLVEGILNGRHVERKASYYPYGRTHTFPYLFVHAGSDKPTWFIPEELRDVFKEADFNVLTNDLHTNEEVSRLLHLFAALGGVAKLTDVYEAYCQLSLEENCTEEAFTSLVKSIASKPGSPIGIKRCDGCECVVFTRRYTRQSNERSNSYHSFYDEFSYDNGLERRSFTSSGFTHADELIRRHEGILPFASTEQMLGKEANEFVYGLPSVQALTHYFDAHVPEDEDEFFFADTMIDELINDIMLCRCSLASIIATLIKDGWYLSEGSNTSPILTKLVLNLYRELPRWDLNGWSEIGYADMQGLPYLISESWLSTDELPLAS